MAIAFENSWKVPVYLNGDRIGYTLVSPQDLGYAINDVVSKFIREDQNTKIIFVNEDIQPIIIVQYPELNYDIRSGNFSEIGKVVITFDNMKYINEEYIYEELTSSKSQHRVFGYLNDKDELYIIDDLFGSPILNIEFMPVMPYYQYDNEDLIYYLCLLDGKQNRKYLYDKYNRYSRIKLHSMIRTQLEQIGHIINHQQ